MITIKVSISADGNPVSKHYESLNTPPSRTQSETLIQESIEYRTDVKKDGTLVPSMEEAHAISYDIFQRVRRALDLISANAQKVQQNE